MICVYDRLELLGWTFLSTPSSSLSSLFEREGLNDFVIHLQYSIRRKSYGMVETQGRMAMGDDHRGHWDDNAAWS